MNRLRRVLRDTLGRPASRSVIAAAAGLAAVLVPVAVLPVTAQAASQPLLPFRCFAQTGTDHIVFGPASVDFSPTRILAPSATGFPPLAAQPGAAGEPGYSPLVQVVFRGTTVVLDAPQIANATGRADKIVAIARNHRTVSYRETDGCYDNESVHYASFDASDPGAAAIEDVTYAPDLNAAPSAGCADPAVVAATCSRESLIAFTNGQTGATNPQRQGLNAAILDGASPLNLLKEAPHPGALFDYSPMWDVHLETWTDAAVAAGLNLRQTDFSAALLQVTSGNATGFPPGSPFGPSGFVVNCPVVSLDVNFSG